MYQYKRPYLLITPILKGDHKPVDNANLLKLSFSVFLSTAARWIFFESNFRRYFTTSDDKTSDGLLQRHAIHILVSMTHTFDPSHFLIVFSQQTQTPINTKSNSRAARSARTSSMVRQSQKVARKDSLGSI